MYLQTDKARTTAKTIHLRWLNLYCAPVSATNFSKKPTITVYSQTPTCRQSAICAKPLLLTPTQLKSFSFLKRQFSIKLKDFKKNEVKPAIINVNSPLVFSNTKIIKTRKEPLKQSWNTIKKEPSV